MKNSNNHNIINPARIYKNADVEKAQIISENKGKPGVYL